jgi:hypothetical protein
MTQVYIAPDGQQLFASTSHAVQYVQVAKYGGSAVDAESSPETVQPSSR